MPHATLKKLEANIAVPKDEFKSFLDKAGDLFHSTENPICTDPQYDRFKRRYVDTFGPYVKIGSTQTLSKGFAKARHEIPMGSLEEFDTTIDVVESIKKWAAKYSKEDLYCTSEKLDGLSVSVKYESGKLIQALTRGDGVEGDDITSNVMKMNICNELAHPFTGHLRGEIVLLKSVKQKYFPEFANERNGCVGIIKRISGEGCDKLNVFFYKAYSNKDTPKTETDILDFIKNILKLPTPRYYTTTLEVLLALHKRYQDEVRDKLDYLLDGLVVNIDNVARQLEINENELLPTFARKFKFESEEVETELLQVKPQVGRTGAITPLAILEPVLCGGVTISNCTLHNYDEIQRLGVEAGDIVGLIRSKDVIPKIVRVVRKNDYSTPILPPTACPECGGGVVKEDVIYYCRNEECGGRISKSLVHWLTVLGIQNMGPKIVEGLIDAGKLKAIPDFYKLEVGDIAGLEHQGEKNDVKILKEIHDRKEILVSTLLAGIGIRNLSSKRAEILETNFGTLDNILSLKTDQLLALDGFEETLAVAISSGLKAKKSLILEILKHVSIKQKVTGVLTGKSFCFSGFRDLVKADLIKAKGGSVSEGFSKKLSYLVVIDKRDVTTKIKKAKEGGVNIIDVGELDKILNNMLF